mmetsp:Transcript_31169/g.77959  ORF Transcript_31169/g.77959 Transcript_31169/m.77959 type:complete len:342 (+) Transcript_31169:321-1346(+)
MNSKRRSSRAEAAAGLGSHASRCAPTPLAALGVGQSSEAAPLERSRHASAMASRKGPPRSSEASPASRTRKGRVRCRTEWPISPPSCDASCTSTDARAAPSGSSLARTRSSAARARSSVAVGVCAPGRREPSIARSHSPRRVARGSTGTSAARRAPSVQLCPCASAAHSSGARAATASAKRTRSARRARADEESGRPRRVATWLSETRASARAWSPPSSEAWRSRASSSAATSRASSSMLHSALGGRLSRARASAAALAASAVPDEAARSALIATTSPAAFSSQTAGSSGAGPPPGAWVLPSCPVRKSTIPTMESHSRSHSGRGGAGRQRSGRGAEAVGAR